jgi:3-hydroxyacyl-CoA dehydrogenase
MRPSLVPGITKEFNDIDEAMRLGFNWAKGPFEMLEEIGVKNFFNKVENFSGNDFLENLSKTKNEIFMVRDKIYKHRNFRES